MQEAARRLEDGGRIINLSTGLTRAWPVNVSVYAGSKAAVEQFSKALAKEVGSRGITVNAVLPGVVETDLTAGMAHDIKENARKNSSFGRLGTPEDIADAVAFLAGNDARWITGQSIVANGGTTP
jgi:3-oxoacyl-[acyl-carrier protein] reductase